MRGIAFFNNPEMEYIGMGEAMGHLTDAVLHSVFPFREGNVFASDTLFGTTGQRPTDSVVITHVKNGTASDKSAEDPFVRIQK